MKYSIAILLFCFSIFTSAQIETYKAYKAKYPDLDVLAGCKMEFIFDYNANEISVIQENNKTYKILDKTGSAVLMPLSESEYEHIFYAETGDEFYVEAFRCENDVTFFIMQKKEDYDENLYRYVVMCSLSPDKLPIYFFVYKK